MELDWHRLVEAVLRRDLRALSRLISCIENRNLGWRQAMRDLMPHTGKVRVIGITGPPGSGKSTLTGQLAACFDDKGWDVAIVAVDPSSMRSGGALLGDRLRMQENSRDDIFVRSLASRGTLGGLSQATRDVVRILDAFGKTLVLLETVGAGQGEVDVADVADVVTVICIPGQGDQIQALKAGIMEIGDVFVINKADLDGADQVAADVVQALNLRRGDSGLNPVVMRTTASHGKGVEELTDVLIDRICAQKPYSVARRQDRLEKEILGIATEELQRLIRKHPAYISLRERCAADMATPLDPYELCDALFQQPVDLSL
jgi:LAO/AO transport system kinase